MRTCLSVFVASILSVAAAHGQGQVWFYTPQAQTRIGSSNGPFAGPGFWGQLLAGPSPDSLLPVGTPREHLVGGVIIGPVLEVSTVPCNTLGYAQLVVWDGTLWGTAFQNVPADQRGASDIVSLFFNCPPIPVFAPRFTQPAIVPVPEPSVVALAIVALVLAAWRQRLRPRPG